MKNIRETSLTIDNKFGFVFHAVRRGIFGPAPKYQRLAAILQRVARRWWRESRETEKETEIETESKGEKERERLGLVGEPRIDRSWVHVMRLRFTTG